MVLSTVKGIASLRRQFLETEMSMTRWAPELAKSPLGQGCPDGTVPFKRFLLEDLEKYPTLDAWLNQRGNPAMPPTTGHDYAARYQFISNIGIGLS